MSLRGLIIMDEDAGRMVYGPDEVRDLSRHVDLLAPPMTNGMANAHPALLGEADVIVSGWGGPKLDAEFLGVAKRLKLFLYGAGSLAGILTDAVWARGITVTSALAANAVPVAEYALGTILISMKHGWRLSREARQNRTFDSESRNGTPGCYRSTVGVVSMGAVARKLVDLLRPLEMNVVVYDPFLSAAEAADLGVRRVPLAELFYTADVVSLHTPMLAETEGMITGELLASMKLGATFINTARAQVVCQDDMIRIAANRPDLQFVLDVVYPEPPVADSPLYELPNILLTPHIAGSSGPECRRMGRYMIDELQRFVAGEPLRWAVTPESVRNTSHRPAATVFSTPRPLQTARAT